MKPVWYKALMPHLLAILIFIGISFGLCSPVLEGKSLFQSDMMHYKGMQKEALDYYEKTGDLPLWSNSMFGGMPTYIFYSGPSANKLGLVNKAMTLFLPNPVDMFYLLMIGMYLLCCVIGCKYWIRIAGAVAYGLATFTIISIDAGHITKVMSMAYMAPVLAGIILTYRGKYLLGGSLTLLATALLIYNNHPQIVYYTLIIGVCLFIAGLVNAFQEKTLLPFAKATGTLIIAAVLAAIPAMDNLMVMNEYTPYTIRGSHSELKSDNPSTGSKGLDINYAFQWSYGQGETFTLLLPHLLGGSTNEKLSTSSNTYKTLIDIGVPQVQAENAMNNGTWQLYWGGLPFTSGPVYIGVIICFLFILALFIVDSWHKWWLLAATLIGIVLSWGYNLPGLNNFLFNHLPLYNKFRTPTMALVIPQLTMVTLAVMGLQEILYGNKEKKFLLQHLKIATIVTTILIGLIAFGGSMLYRFTGPGDPALMNRYAQMLGGEVNAARLMGAIRQDRAAALSNDGLRAFIYLLLSVIPIWYALKGKLKVSYATGIVALLIVADLFTIGKQYMNESNFSEDLQVNKYITPSAADQQILQDKDPYYRVLNVTTNPWLDANTSYFHKSVGGQSPAKLWIYEDLIQHQLSKNNMAVYNMLNTRYFIVQDNKTGQPVAQRNPEALGNAWFIKGINWVPDANSEMSALDHFNPADTVVIDQRFKSTVGDFSPYADSSSKITLTEYSLNQLSFKSQNQQEGLGVFSDIYYPAGWNAYIDGKSTPILRVNYALRGLKIPAGQHEILFKFKPKTFFTARKISGIASIGIMALVVAGFGLSVWRKE
ncbi:hypothetical protein DVR12_21030 [Chitinophaga silvatica]|uniref:Membrane protein YfhO n=1 Tax=Chitinophaga silvatica TaxID=2282649 RepID=A0A3E1Y676_9BACT|nr:YfhO family protein [Chitinophaga silvatica]RFS20202.1 hypothetical protein DVR12_21030 [Chitinophaga silvatica]